MLDIKSILARWVHPALLLVMIAILTYGAVFLQYAVRGELSWTRQMQGIALGLILMAVVWFFDYRKLQHWLMPLFAFNVLLLISPRLPIIGHSVSGANRWINLGFTTVQPSELAKIVTIILLAAIIARYGGRIEDPKTFLKVVGLSLIPFFAVMTQPDLGTGLVFLVVMIALLFLGGAKLRYMAALIAGGIVVIACVFWVNAQTWDYDRRGGQGDYLILRHYQMMRLRVFMDRELDPTGAGYDLNQSMIAIGSGGMTGKGLGEGTQSQLDFLSERSTDYIFSVLGEETGFVGTVALIGLYMALLLVALSIASKSSDLFGTLICGGIIAMWAFQIMQNIGMTMGLMPITGIPLPFMSYGLSAIVTNIIACGLLFAVWSRRPYQTQMRGGSHDITI